jgi:hypothetical protein
MARNCIICDHKDRQLIEKEIVKGYSKNKIALRFNVPEYSLRYHEDHHLTRQLKTAYEMKKAQNGLDVFSELENMILDIKAIVTKAKDRNHDAKFLNATRELRNSLELLSKIKFAMAQANGSDIHLTEAEKREKKNIEESKEQLNLTIEENMEILHPEERTAYFSILMKLMNGTKDRCQYIKYNDRRNVPTYDFDIQNKTAEISVSNPEVNTIHYSDKKLSNNGSFKRTKGVSRPAPEQDAKDSYPTRVGPVESIEIPYDKTNRRRY